MTDDSRFLTAKMSAFPTRCFPLALLCGLWSVSALGQQEDGEFGLPNATGNVGGGISAGVPDLCPNPNVFSIRSGAWNDRRTWSNGRVPANGDRVGIRAGHSVSIASRSDAPLQCIDVSGALAFDADRATRLVVGTLIVQESGGLEIGTEKRPIVSSVAAELIIADQELDPLDDVEQFGTGLIVLGRLTIQGASKGSTFARVKKEPMVGETTISVGDEAATWQVGDRLVLPDTRQLRREERGSGYEPQWEEMVIRNRSTTSLSLNHPLRFSHRGAHSISDVGLLPHAANLTRNVIVRSQNPNGTRGHVFVTGTAQIKVRNALFQDLGRTQLGVLNSARYDALGIPRNYGTNQVGRYPVHFFELDDSTERSANEYRFVFEGNAVVGSPKWGIVIDSSNAGWVSRNVVFGTPGAGIVTVGGAETSNVFKGNIVVFSRGSGNFEPRSAYFSAAVDSGGEGSGFYLRGPLNVLQGNVVANVDTYGYAMATGALDTSGPQDGRVEPEGLRLTRQANANERLREFKDNEAYGTLQSGAAIGWNGVLRDFRVWHAWRHGVSVVPADSLEIVNLSARGDATVLKEQFESPVGIWLSNYTNKSITITGADIEGFRVGIASPFYAAAVRPEPGDGNSTVSIDGSRFRNYVGIAVATSYSALSNPSSVKRLFIRNDRFERLESVPPSGAHAPAAISMNYGMAIGDMAARAPAEVEGFNGNIGDSFRVLYSLGLRDVPAGCDATKPDISGFVCPAHP